MVFEAAAGMRVSNEVQVAERERPAAMLVVRLNGSRFGDSRRHCNTAIGASLGLNLRMAKDALAVKEKQNVEVCATENRKAAALHSGSDKHVWRVMTTSYAVR